MTSGFYPIVTHLVLEWKVGTLLVPIPFTIINLLLITCLITSIAGVKLASNHVHSKLLFCTLKFQSEIGVVAK